MYRMCMMRETGWPFEADILGELCTVTLTKWNCNFIF